MSDTWLRDGSPPPPALSDPLDVEDHTSPLLRQPPYVPKALMGDWLHFPPTVRERSMLLLINDITDDPSWRSLVTDNAVVERWRSQLDLLVTPPPAPRTLGHTRSETKRLNTPSVSAKSQSAFNTRNGPIRDTLPTLPPHLAVAGFTESMFDYCIAELRAKASLCEAQRHDIVKVLDIDAAVCKLNTPTIADLAKTSLAPLEAEALEGGDFRPDRGYAVLPLAHSTLYPIVYGRTRILPTPTLTRDNCLAAIGSGTAIPSALITGDQVEPLGNTYEYHFFNKVRSRKHAWLPTDVEVKAGGKCKVLGYLNNVHPVRHAGVYDVVEQMLEAALPALMEVVESVKETRLDVRAKAAGRLPPRNSRIPWVSPPYNLFDCKAPEKCEGTCRANPLYSVDMMRQQKNLRRGRLDAKQKEEWRIRVDENRRRYEDFKLKHPIVQPEPEAFRAGHSFPVGSFSYALPSRLQIILQINNHVLTPSNPTYAGGDFHLEGMVNEHIVATAILYYDLDNVTTSRLSLRTHLVQDQLDDDDHGITSCGYRLSPLSNEDLDYRWQARDQAYGGLHDGDVNLNLGGITATPGRMVVFPNVLEHRVDPFELIDKTRPGHRKMIAFFLVDPAVNLVSTSRVPPQQLDWADSRSRSVIHTIDSKLPAELTSIILDDLQCPYSLDVAKNIRDEVMDERGGGKTLKDDMRQEQIRRMRD